ncbi:MAG TPA: F0F1 ATP synthase subunit A [Pirellulaceae bacterium]|nr:F0F1 ATP synthase subunit A [Pirellulaceae bacterium]
MANPVLHIKDSYYFELPKFLCPADYKSLHDYPDRLDVWVSLDEEYQNWHFDRIYDLLEQKVSSVRLLEREYVREQWHKWQHESHDNFGKPFDEFLETAFAFHKSQYPAWKATQLRGFHERQKQSGGGKEANTDSAYQSVQDLYFDDFLHEEAHRIKYGDYWSFSQWRSDPLSSAVWKEIRREANNVAQYKQYCRDNGRDWSEEKLKAYNYHLSGKVVIPQPFNAKLRNLYEAHDANQWYEFAISKFMIIELIVAFVIGAAFIWLARKVRHGDAPKGKMWNLLETFVVFIRDQVAEPSIGHHDAFRFTPFLWTIFFFVLGCNLMGMLPWLGSPTGASGVTLALAMVTFVYTLFAGTIRFGVPGFFKNLVPHMDLPLIMAIFIKPMLFVIELIGLVIKHAVLSVRLMANIMAGHLVLVAIMGIAFSVAAATSMANWQWAIAAPMSVLGSATLSLLELFVAFLQAYIFAFLSALFIGAALHEH